MIGRVVDALGDAIASKVLDDAIGFRIAEGL
jgi:hypothetical protein